MTKNPLTTTVIVLYSPQSPGSKAWFYSILPLFPLYFGLKVAGITEPPATNVVYLVAFAIYALAVPLLWKQNGNTISTLRLRNLYLPHNES